ncbi:hypothetical protein HYPSUDRAFT_798599 [Hypholoma sublateritium FD-334 SS-4]|uniref:BTB domain-containing protein n=1 Tax=Hypholoma sublateritium (strain FD-334 SS-4) TaxID=945553 RepID=A0A0D2LK11_HYPSF|nr:hypothetical protein HYPSUDRAFT_798599 [Hypholoma sublateritium FD-334 SS-4]
MKYLGINSSPVFWFDDGNIVLQTGDTQFRVHRSLLASYSVIMKDCFEIPRAEVEETVEGCPVLRLDDSTKDIENLCGLLFGMYQVESKTVGFAYLETMLRLGPKYEIANFKIMALARLYQLFPRDLGEWEHTIDLRSELTRFSYQPTSKGFVFDVINAAYQTDSQIPSILPAAFLFLYLKHNLAEIISGVQRSDQSLATLQPQALHAALSGRTNFMSLWISLFRTRLEIDEEYRFRITYKIPGQYCMQKEVCMKSLANVLGQLTAQAVGIHPVCIPLQIREIWYEGDMPDPEEVLPEPFCEPCRHTLRDSFYSSQEDWWKSLPRCFQLPSWEKMQDFDM